MRKRWWGLALFSAVVTLGGAAYWTRFYLSEPERTYTRLHDAACRGDADASFALHDMSEVRTAMVQAVKARSGAGALAERAVEQLWDDAIDDWREDIEKKRWNSDTCAWEVVSIHSSLYGGGDVIVRQPSGKRRLIKIKRFGEGPFATALVVESFAMERE